MNVQAADIIRELPPFRNERKLLRTRQSISDIEGDLLYKHKLNRADARRIARKFWRGSAYETAKGLFDFLKSNTRNKEEDTYNQTVRALAGVISGDRPVDCKHYSQFTVSICCALYELGYPIKAKYRFAIYNDTPDEKRVKRGHVFAVVLDRGQEYWVDPVLPAFNQRYPKYLYAYDKYPEMEYSVGEVWEVNGTPYLGNQVTLAGMRNETTLAGMANSTTLGTMYERPVAGRVGWLEEYYNRQGALGRHNPKSHHAHHGLHIKIQPGKILKKFGLAAPRNAFLLYLKQNLFHTGSKIYAKMLKDPGFKQQIFDTWRRIGGNTNKLSTALTQAMHVWNRHHRAHAISPGGSHIVRHQISGDPHLMDWSDSSMGVAPETAYPAILAAAAPIIKIFSDLLKKAGITHASDADIDKAEKDTINDHNNATDTTGDGKKDINADGSVDHGNGITTSVSTDANRKQTLKLDATDTDQQNDGGDVTTTTKTKTKTVTHEKEDQQDHTDGEEDNEDETVKTKTKIVTKQSDGGEKGIVAFWDTTKNFFVKNRWVILGVIFGSLVLGRILVPMATGYLSHPRKRR